MVPKVLATASIAFLILASASGPSLGASCAGAISNVSAVSTGGLVRPNKNYSGDRDLTTILATKVTTDKPVTCVIVHVSAYIQPADNHAVFQVRLNGTPMAGHANAFPGTEVRIPEISEPVHNLPKWVMRTAPALNPKPPGYPARDNFYDVPRTVGYTFFQAVKGKTTAKIELRAADCCSPRRGTGTTKIHAATLTVFY